MDYVTNALRRQRPEVLAAGAVVGLAFVLARMAEEPERARRRRRQDEAQSCICFTIIVALIANAMWSRVLKLVDTVDTVDTANTADLRTCLMWETRIATHWDDMDQKMRLLSSEILELDVFLCQTAPQDACIGAMGGRGASTVGELLAWGLARLSHFDAPHQSHVERGKGDTDSALLTKMRAVSHILGSVIRSVSGGGTLATAHRVIDECYGRVMPTPQPKRKREDEQKISKPALRLRCFYDSIRQSGGWKQMTLAAVASCATQWTTGTCSPPLPLQAWAAGIDSLTKDGGVRSTCPWDGAAERVYWSKSLDMGMLIKQIQAWRDAVLVATATAASSAPHQPRLSTALSQERQQEVLQKQFVLGRAQRRRLASILQSYGTLQRQRQPIRVWLRWLGSTLMSYMHWSHPLIAAIAVPAFPPIAAMWWLSGEPDPDPAAIIFIGFVLLVALFWWCAPSRELLVRIGFYGFTCVAIAEVCVYSVSSALVLLAGSDPALARLISTCVELLSPLSDSVTSMPAECVALLNGAFAASFEAFEA